MNSVRIVIILSGRQQRGRSVVPLHHLDNRESRCLHIGIGDLEVPVGRGATDQTLGDTCAESGVGRRGRHLPQTGLQRVVRE